MRTRNHLVLVAWDDHPKTISDLSRIAERVPKVNPAVAATVVMHHRRDQLRLLPLWLRPTLSVALIEKSNRKLLPGRFITGRRLGKHGEYERMDRAGIPVPRWEIIVPGTRLDSGEWGPYVVEKPSHGRVGANIVIRRTGRLKYIPPEELPSDHFGRRGPMLAQRFVYTGEWPTSYRIVTLFGQVLLSYRIQTVGRGRPLKHRWDFDAGGITIVANTRSMSVALDPAEDVVALAERAHRKAFPDVPLLGFDIVRDADTGGLFVLECHAQGSAWMFSSTMGLQIQSDHGVDFEAQYGAIDKAAGLLAEATPRLAALGWPLTPVNWTSGTA